jgi:NAD(P)-dependent dehydrogenase (short-subunit alcohol dehydrogenase family)
MPLAVLINNAGIALIPQSDRSDLRPTYNHILNTNVSSIALCTSLFLPLLKSSSPHPRVLNVSSVRASLALLSSGKLPPTVSVPYSISKVALNALTLENALANKEVWFGAVSPGHCKTAFNGWRGRKDPVDGARVVVELAFAEGGRWQSGGFWQMEGEEREPTSVAW